MTRNSGRNVFTPDIRVGDAGSFCGVFPQSAALHTIESDLKEEVCRKSRSLFCCF